MNNDEINKKLLDDLKNLPRVDAPNNFETELWRKINSSEEVKKESFWERLFTPGKIAPAAVAVASAIIIFFVVDGNSNEMEDPLNIEPRMREDIVMLNATDEIPVTPNQKSKIYKEEKKDLPKGVVEETNKKESSIPNKEEKSLNEIYESEQENISEELRSAELKSDSNLSDDAGNSGGTVMPSATVTGATEINRSNLNFMQRNLSTAEKDEVQQLKKKVESQKSAKIEENQTKSTQK